MLLLSPTIQIPRIPDAFPHHKNLPNNIQPYTNQSSKALQKNTPLSFSLICPKNPLQKPQKMPKKRSPILKKALGFFTLSIPMEKLKRPINRDLLIFKKTRKIRTLKFLKHHSYNYIEEYRFSPSSTPLSKNSRISLKKSRQGLYSMLLLCHCSGNSSSDGEEEEEEERDRLDAPIDFDEMGSEPKSLGLSEEEEEESDSVDRRAEKFIERFYEEIRMQRQQSALEYTQMLDRSS